MEKIKSKGMITVEQACDDDGNIIIAIIIIMIIIEKEHN